MTNAQINPRKIVFKNDERAELVAKRRSSSLSSSSSSLKGMLSSKIRLSALNYDTFDMCLSPDFTSSYDEHDFSKITAKAAELLGAEKCFLFIRDSKEQKLYTYLKESEGKIVIATKPIDRGITGFVLSESAGCNLNKAQEELCWMEELDELPNFVTTCYLAWPIHDFTDGKSIGVVEFRNKLNGSSSFNAADSQFARIIALQLGHAIVNSKQKELIADHSEAIHHTYEAKNFDQGETIDITCDSGVAEKHSLSVKSGGGTRGAFMLSKHPSIFNVRRSSVAVNDRAWDYDVFQKSEQELSHHAIDIFDERGLLSRYSIPMSTFCNFLTEIKAGYSSAAPYHNSYHAFDVMHVSYLLMTKCGADEYLESFNVLSILVAALAHDLGHDGYNNAFHQNTNSDHAVTYNGISILENYSAAYLFRILRKKECNILARLSDEEMAKMRSRLIDLILDTDAKNHYMLMTRFKHGLEMKKLSRGLLSSLILHVSDVSNPTRPGTIARKWAYCVQTEFFRQGDKEIELGLPRSPFMDRSHENLPRMQIAFIDAVVHPVFRLLADFLPLVEDHCIKPLQLNRAFWQSMLHRGILKTEDVVSFIEKSKGKDVSFLLPNCKDGDANANDRVASNHAIGETHIPGIPSDATHSSTDVDVRRASVISLNNSSRQEMDPELGRVFEEKNTPMRRISLQRTVMQSRNILYTALKRCLESPLFQALTFACTMFALFAFDFNLALGDKRTDPLMDWLTLSVFIIFVVEICLSLLCTKGYLKFFFWLDVIATTSLYFEIGFFMDSFENTEMGTGLNDFALARAGRAAKVGARAGRLLRLIRLLKIFKFATWTLKRVIKGNRRNDPKEDEIEKDLTFSMSIIGRRMTESITKKVIIAVVLMLIVFSATTTDMTPDARQIQLDAIAIHPNSTVLRESFFASHDNIVAFGSGSEFDVLDGERLDSLRDVEILTLVSDTDEAVFASFDISQDTATQAILSIIITAFVSILLASMGLLFSRDAYQLVIHPIEKMKHTVQQLSENPLLHLERVKNHRGNQSSETDVLELAITKMAALLQIGFGSAGAEIIAKNLSDMGELNPMIPGVRVNAIFGFADIRNFTFATEGLQGDVLIFVNKIAAITHKHVVNSGGHPNKNIGDAFLLVWKLKAGKNGTNSSGDLQKDLFDSALAACQRVIRDIQNAGNLASFLDDDVGGNVSAAWASSLKSYNVAIGVGLHKGWAIEGAIGSKVKIDASYLSPHVNIASRLEAATKQYRVPLLMSEAFFTGLSGANQATCRRVDRVIFKGSTDPMQIYHQDVEPLSNLTTPSSNHINLVAMTSWDEDTENDYRGLIRDAQSKIESDNEMAHRDLFDSLMNAYLDKEWTMCKIYSHLWVKKWPGDRIVVALIEELSRYNFVCPDDWQCHKLTEK
jgi:class 3 adenylate cyclase